MADRRLRRSSTPSEGSNGEGALRQALVDRVGLLGWVVEGCIESIHTAGVASASALWGEEAVDLLWERGILIATDHGPDETRLADDAQRWAEARRCLAVAGAGLPGRIRQSPASTDAFVERLAVLRWDDHQTSADEDPAATPTAAPADSRELVGI